MKTSMLRRFLCTNAIDYYSLPSSGEHESMHNQSEKLKWLRQGKAALKELANNLGAIATLSTNPSGDIDRGYVSGFFSKNGKVVYIQFSDGCKNILFRTAEHIKDYTGGRNNDAPLTGMGSDRLTEWLKNELN